MGQMGNRLPVYLFAILLSSIGTAGTSIANSYLVKNIVNAAYRKSMDGIFLLVFLNFMMLVLSQVLWRFSIIRYNIEARVGIAGIEKRVFSKAMRLPMSYYEQHHSGDFMSKLVFDTEKAGDIYTSRLRRFLAAVISAVAYLIPMFYFSIPLTLCLVGLSLLSFLINFVFTKPMKQTGKDLSAQNSIMTEKLTNLLAGIELTKIFPAGAKLGREYQEANEICCKTQYKANHLYAALDCANCFFDLTGGLAFLGLGLFFVSRETISLGELAALYSLYGSFRFVFLDIGKYLPQLMNCLANAESLYYFLEQEEEPCNAGWKESPEKISEKISEKIPENTSERIFGNTSKKPPARPTDTSDFSKISIRDITYTPDTPAVSVKHLTFSYDGTKQILQNFSMQVKQGCYAAIVGASGCGKSTLAKLLLGFYPPSSGEIEILGHSYNDLSMADIRNLIGYVPQEPYLYEVSIAENIAYGQSPLYPENVPMSEIITAAKAANAHDFIMRLPNGYDTIPGERGNTLSGGEKQRIAIARAIMKNAPILLLDEATSALDNESEQLVNEALDRLCKNRTTLMIAHRQSTIAMADTVISLTEQG